MKDAKVRESYNKDELENFGYRQLGIYFGSDPDKGIIFKGSDSRLLCDRLSDGRMMVTHRY